MDILFTTNEKFWSRVFCAIAREPVSHLAFRFDLDGTRVVIDCTKPRGRILPFEKFDSYNEIKYIVRIDCDHALEGILYRRCLDIVGTKYDTGAWVYGVWRGLLKHLFNIKLPKINLLSDPLKLACTEIFYPIDDLLKDEFQISFDDMDLAMQSPYMIFNFLKETQNVDKEGS
jgi:hypothetical protein